MESLIGIVGCRNLPRKDNVMILKPRFTKQEIIAALKRLSIQYIIFTQMQ